MFKKIIHNIKIFKALSAMNIKILLIYRKSLYISLVAMVCWMIVYAMLIEVLYGHTNTIAGWEKGEMLIILSFYYLITSFANFLYRDSFEQFGEKMRQGELDIYLTKPSSFQVQCFLSSMRFDQLTSPFLVILLFLYGASQLSEPLLLSNMIIGLIYSILSVFFYYHFLLIVSTLNFYLEKADTLGSVMWNLSQIGRYPRQIFTGGAKIFFQFIFPMALMVSIPSEIFVGFEKAAIHLQFLLIITIFSLVSQLIFTRGLKRYSSAN